MHSNAINNSCHKVTIEKLLDVMIINVRYVIIIIIIVNQSLCPVFCVYVNFNTMSLQVSCSLN